MAFIIAGERSGVGKTTITLALLSFLARQQEWIQSFKVGPDYIDPMFHTQVTGRPCRNLDPVLTGPDYVQQCFFRHCQGTQYALIEGVMGLFDGVCFHQQNDYASTAHIARILNIPVVLVIDASRLSGSVGAIAQGYTNFDPQVRVAGIILNRVGSDRHLELLKTALEPLQMPILGVFRRQENIALRHRHLGLVPTEEVESFPQIQDRLATIAQNSLDWDQIFPLLGAPQTAVSLLWDEIPPHTPVRIGIARDRAFNFYYQDNLDLLEHLGAELIPWSPLHDSALPPSLDRLYFVGGFPEVFAEELSHNRDVIQQLQAAIANGIPTYAECGGLMYLSQSITDLAGETWPMAEILPTHTIMEKRLTLGYRQAIPYPNNPLLSANTAIWGHEFHRSQLQTPSASPLYQLCDLYRNQYQEGWKLGSVYASYLHLHWGNLPHFPKKFIQGLLK
ncbi:MAG: cobyrinic acid a,c-diamide synthase [Cyanobacteria bacterium SW_9_44_58]|nr:MAG: cobyrinic acid a,c-diamide synthase [Cyanobacteria bacterium SW_9_44_58]